jgi:hypothetical protein
MSKRRIIDLESKSSRKRKTSAPDPIALLNGLLARTGWGWRYWVDGCETVNVKKYGATFVTDIGKDELFGEIKVNTATYYFDPARPPILNSFPLEHFVKEYRSLVFDDV